MAMATFRLSESGGRGGLGPDLETQVVDAAKEETRCSFSGDERGRACGGG
ncbi:hypothetical protein TIFTF001_004044 [Ficus carica]|uniref:Uncharacterized protein n=1 Tax=Ficus carica TaxID=3494 RepID=A0AA88A2X3_FICCA|nr:hypothetical protein TIFTF001_004044 [Ficus carica]